MVKIFKYFLLLIISSGFFHSCAEDMDDVRGNASFLEINDFVYRGMNDLYLYKSYVPVLADNYFEDQDSYYDYLGSFENPEDLFYNGLVATTQDRFSYITSNYVELENSLAGISKTSGMDYRVRYIDSGVSNEIVGYVRYVNPNTSASEQGVERGMLFLSVDGQQLTGDNYIELLNQDSYTIGLAEIGANGQYVLTGQSISLTQNQYTINPIHSHKIIELNDIKVGYLMYNAFVADYDQELNDIFGEFKTQGIQELVLDLRYNGGGSVNTAENLASMITGQFNGEIFLREEWNETYQALYESSDPESLYYRFDNVISSSDKTTINSLGLTRLYVLGTGATASASELVINSLRPYIDVVQVGTRTVGKFQASVTLYDAPDYRRLNANPNHTYAIQPLVFKSENANGVSDYVNGLNPDIEVEEELDAYGVLGDENEPLLAAALAHISGESTMSVSFRSSHGSNFSAEESHLNEPIKNTPDYQRMYIDQLPVIP